MWMSWLEPASAAVLAIVSLPLADQSSSNASPQPVDILKIENERYNRMTVPVRIDNHGPYDFMIDTGAEATVVSRDLADRLGLFDRNSARLIAMASTREVETAYIPDLALGSRSFNIATAPLVERENIGGSADGVLGLDSLQNQRVLLDFDKQQIAVADAEELGGNKGYEIVVKARRKLGQLIITEATFDGNRVAVVIDTGAESSIGNEKLMSKLRGRQTYPTQMIDMNGVEVDGHVRLARDVQIGRVKLTNIAVSFFESPVFKQLGLDDQPAMVLGMNELRLFRRVAIDFKERKVLFDLPRAHGKSDEISQKINIQL
jgi:predicted aspartyl protease